MVSGGKRVGAGRPSSKKVRCNVMLAPDVLVILNVAGKGNRSAGIEAVARKWATAKRRK